LEIEYTLAGGVAFISHKYILFIYFHESLKWLLTIVVAGSLKFATRFYPMVSLPL